MATFENVVMISRPIEDVFGFLSDFENVPKWNYQGEHQPGFLRGRPGQDEHLAAGVAELAGPANHGKRRPLLSEAEDALDHDLPPALEDEGCLDEHLLAEHRRRTRRRRSSSSSGVAASCPVTGSRTVKPE